MTRTVDFLSRLFTLLSSNRNRKRVILKKHKFFHKISIFAVCLLFPYKAVLNLVKAVLNFVCSYNRWRNRTALLSTVVVVHQLMISAPKMTSFYDDIIFFYDFCNFLTVFLLQSGFKPCIALIIKQTSGALNIENNKLVFCISSNNFRTHWSVANNNNTKTKTSKSKLSNEIQAIKSYYATLCKVARMRKSVLSKFCKSSRTMSLTISFNLPMNRSVLWLLLSMLFQNIGDEKHAIHGENLLSSVKNLVTVCISKALAGCQHF